MDKIYLIMPERIGQINPDIYGVFSEHIGGVIYDGIWVGEDSEVENVHGFRKFIIDRLREAEVPLIRWPGGCFAETYNWRDGIGDRSKRPTRINWWNSCDGRYEPNIVGTDEFLDFCALCGAKPYIAANLTSTTPLDIRDWIDYVNSPEGTTTMAKLRAENGHPAPYDVRLWGVGNENWGGGGNMTPQFYANEYRRYATVMENSSKGLELIACGANAGDYNWTKGLCEGICEHGAPMHGMAVHYYCGSAGDTIGFSTDEWNQLIKQASKMQELIDRHWSIVKAYGMESKAKLCIDEWGCWHQDKSGLATKDHLFEQQSTIRDAVVSALTLNIFNNNCDKIRLAAAAQLVNNLHTLFLSLGKDCITTPTYHVFNMFKSHKAGEAFRVIGPDDISASASVKDGEVTLTIANLSPERDYELELDPVGFGIGEGTLTQISDDDLHAHNTFDNPERVSPVEKASKKVVELPHGAIAAIKIKII